MFSPIEAKELTAEPAPSGEDDDNECHKRQAEPLPKRERSPKPVEQRAR